MEYKWDINNFKKDLKSLKELLKKETNEEKKAELKYYIDELNRTIKIENIEELYAKKRECLGEVVLTYSRYQRYFEIFNQYNAMRNKILNKYNLTEEQIEDFFFNIEEVYKFKKYSTEECFEIAKEFYGNLDNSMYKNFLKIYKDRYNLVKVEENKYLNIDGCCTFVEGVNKPYIWIGNKPGIQKTNTLIHELAHAITQIQNPKRFVEARDLFGTEIESMFAELIFTNDYLKDKNQVEQALIFLENTFVFFNDIDALINQKIIADSYDKDIITIDKELYNNLRKKFNLTKRNVNDAIMIDMINYGTYVVSYMVALELFHIYRQDKKEAIKILKLFLKDYQKDTYITIRKYLNNLPNVEKEANKLFIKSNKILNKELYKNL